MKRLLKLSLWALTGYAAWLLYRDLQERHQREAQSAYDALDSTPDGRITVGAVGVGKTVTSVKHVSAALYARQRPSYVPPEGMVGMDTIIPFAQTAEQREAEQQRVIDAFGLTPEEAEQIKGLRLPDGDRAFFEAVREAAAAGEPVEIRPEAGFTDRVGLLPEGMTDMPGQHVEPVNPDNQPITEAPAKRRERIVIFEDSTTPATSETPENTDDDDQTGGH